MFDQKDRKKKVLHAKFLFGNGHPLPGDDDTLDLGRALVDLVNLGVSHQLLYRVFTVEPVAAKHLHSVRCRLGKISSNQYLPT